MSGGNYLNTNWQNPSSPPSLTGNRVHVWRASLDLSSCEINSLADILSPDEITRAEKFHFDRHRRRFIAARGILRQLLGDYLVIAPSQVQFCYSDRGKPFLHQSEADSLNFNVSHSEEYALYGFAFDRAIGVDIEYLRPMPDAESIAKRFFAPAELNHIQNAPPQDRHRIFFQLWTAKEAYLKAIGTGLTNMLDSVEIAFDENSLAYFQSFSGERQTTNWKLCPCTPAAKYVGAIAIEDLACDRCDFWHWDCNYSTAI